MMRARPSRLLPGGPDALPPGGRPPALLQPGLPGPPRRENLPRPGDRAEGKSHPDGVNRPAGNQQQSLPWWQVAASRKPYAPLPPGCRNSRPPERHRRRFHRTALLRAENHHRLHPAPPPGTSGAAIAAATNARRRPINSQVATVSRSLFSSAGPRASGPKMHILRPRMSRRGAGSPSAWPAEDRPRSSPLPVRSWPRRWLPT